MYGQVKTEILQAFASDGVALTTDAICKAVPEFGRATVRATLARLVNEGILLRVHMGKFRLSPVGESAKVVGVSAGIASNPSPVGQGEKAPAPCCGGCRYFQQRTNEESGECRRFAPKPGHEREDEGGLVIRRYAQWPIVTAFDWCGDFKEHN